MHNIELFTETLKSITDFRKPQGQRYKLHNLLTIMVLAMLSGCDDFESMALYCKKKATFLRERGLLDEKNFPSHDLFRWIMLHLDKAAFSKILCAWLDSFENHLSADESIKSLKEKRLIHIDGKVLRATRTSEHSRTGLLVLNAYCSNTHVRVCLKIKFQNLAKIISMKAICITQTEDSTVFSKSLLKRRKKLNHEKLLSTCQRPV